MSLKEKFIRKAADKALKGKSAAQLAGLIRKLRKVAGAEEVRRQVIKGIEDDFRKKLKDNPGLSVQDLIQEYLDEPEAMALFDDLSMGDEHLRAMAKNAIADKVKGK